MSVLLLTSTGIFSRPKTSPKIRRCQLGGGRLSQTNESSLEALGQAGDRFQEAAILNSSISTCFVPKVLCPGKLTFETGEKV